MSNKQEIKVPVTFTFDRADIYNILEAALEQHSGYWARPVKIENLDKDNSVVLDMEDDEKELTLSKTDVISGLYKLSQSKEYFHHFRDIVTEDDDGTTADVLLQFCLFGEVKYS